MQWRVRASPSATDCESDGMMATVGGAEGVSGGEVERSYITVYVLATHTHTHMEKHHITNT